MPGKVVTTLDADAELPYGILCSFLFFLARRPISGSNSHYLSSRLAGLKSLIPILERYALPGGVAHVLKQLARLTPQSFTSQIRALQAGLFTAYRSPVDFPPGYLKSARPSVDCFEGCPRVQLIFGPSIGIGDEIMSFALARWIKRRGASHVSVLTTYEGLWDRVIGVDEIRTYRLHSELLDALRPPAEHAPDLTVLVDFEKPGLAPYMANEAAVTRYLEVSLGGQSATLVDRAARAIRAFRMPTDSVVNYYHGLSRIAGWLGLDPDPGRFTELVRTAVDKPAALGIFVSPFTSKFEPSPTFWTQLLTGLLADGIPEGVRVRVDAGANMRTSAFAKALCGSVAMKLRGRFTLEVASAPESTTLPLSGVMGELENARLVLCTDSFVAHAAPVFGCTTLVIAGRELSNWRVPHPRSFYFDASGSASRVASALRIVAEYEDCAIPAESRPAAALLGAGVLLAEASDQVEGSLRSSSAPSDADYARLVAEYELTADGLPAWPPAYLELFADIDYAPYWPALPEVVSREELQEHLGAQLERWSNSNLRKFLRLAAAFRRSHPHAVGREA